MVMTVVKVDKGRGDHRVVNIDNHVDNDMLRSSEVLHVTFLLTFNLLCTYLQLLLIHQPYN